jgi:hypothetical protein
MAAHGQYLGATGRPATDAPTEHTRGQRAVVASKGTLPVPGATSKAQRPPAAATTFAP